MDLSYKHSDEWLCRQHSRDTIKRWINSLTSFYFFRAFGGHANDPDEFKTLLKFDNKKDLEKILASLGISGLSETAYYDHRVINNHDWFVSADFERKRITFSKSTQYNVTDSDFEATMELDKTFQLLDFRHKVDRDIIYDSGCVSRERYYEILN
jgi:hypothetical protein